MPSPRRTEQPPKRRTPYPWTRPALMIVAWHGELRTDEEYRAWWNRRDGLAGPGGGLEAAPRA